MRFELERDDNPPLFDELIKFAKGTKRLNRLRTLAHEGLVAQRPWLVAGSGGSVNPQAQTAGRDQAGPDSVLTAASHELFGPAVDG